MIMVNLLTISRVSNAFVSATVMHIEVAFLQGYPQGQRLLPMTIKLFQNSM